MSPNMRNTNQELIDTVAFLSPLARRINKET